MMGPTGPAVPYPQVFFFHATRFGCFRKCGPLWRTTRKLREKLTGYYFPCAGKVPRGARAKLSAIEILEDFGGVRVCCVARAGWFEAF